MGSLFEERSKLWRDVKAVVESEENVEKAMMMKRNFAYEFYKSVQCKSINIEEDIQRHQGGPMNVQGEPMNVQGEPMNVQGEPMNVQGEPMNVQGEPMNVQDILEISEVQYLLVFPDGQTIEVEHNILTEKLYKPYKLLNYPLYKDEEWLYNIKDLHCNHSVFSQLNDHIEILEKCTRTPDILIKPLHYENKSLLISTIDFLNAFKNELVQSVNELNMVQFSNLISSKAILIHENDEAYELSQDAALKVLSIDKYGFSTKKNQTDLPSVYIEGGVHFKTLSNSMDIHTPFMALTSNTLSKIPIEEQLTNPLILLSLVNVQLVEKESIPNVIKECQISSIEEDFIDKNIEKDTINIEEDILNIEEDTLNIEEDTLNIEEDTLNKNIDDVINEHIIHLDSERIDSMKIRKDHNFIILACRSMNGLEKYFNALATCFSKDIPLGARNPMDKSGRTHLISLELNFHDHLNIHTFTLIPTFKHLRCVEFVGSMIGLRGCRSLSQMTSIRVLDLSSNWINLKECQVLSQMTSIRILDLSDNKIRAEGCRYLSQMTSIRKLDLMGNYVGNEGCQYLSFNTSIRELNVSHNKIGPEGCQYLSQMTSLNTLIMSYNSIGDEGCLNISSNTSIRELDFEWGRIGIEGCQYLSQMTSIRVLDVSNNKKIGPKGCQYLAWNTSIRKLNVTNNDVGNDGCQYLARNTSLRELNLEKNNIGPEGCQYLAWNTSLRALNLSWNHIGNEGCEYLSLNTSIVELNVLSNNIGTEGCPYLSQMTSLRELNLSSNTIRPEGLEHFTSRVKLLGVVR